MWNLELHGNNGFKVFYNFISPNIVWFWKLKYIRYNLKYFYSFSPAELNSIESEDKAFAQEFSDEESDYGDNDVEDVYQMCSW